MNNSNITVDGNTKLVAAGEKGGLKQYNEVYFGWETGNVVQAPREASTADIVKLYQETVTK